MKRIVAVVAVLAFVLSALGLTVAAQQGGMNRGANMGTPMAGEAQGMSMGAFYLTITNSGDADRLVSVQTEVAETVEIHDVVMDGGVMQMMPQHDGVEVPAGGELVLEPGSFHVMLIGLTQSLLAGDEFTATLTFEHAGDVEVTVPVFIGEPGADELTAEPVVAGDLEITGVWARQAPKLDDTAGMGMGTPMADCPMGGQGPMGQGGMPAGECPMGTPMADCPMMTGTPGAGMGHAHGQGGMPGDCPMMTGTPMADCPMGDACPMATPGMGMGHGAGMGTPMAGEAQGMSMGAFYLTITNNGAEADRLVAVTTDVAETVEIHDVVMDGGVMQMVPQFDGVEVPAGGELVLEPGSFHVMLIGLTESLLAGDEFTATLTFEHAGDVEVTVPVFMGEPGADELTAEPVVTGDLEITGVWARQAPKIESGSGAGTTTMPADATPEATPAS